MIDVQNLTKSFDGFLALDGLCLHVPQGSVYGLVGPNGAGKTTLIRHLAGVLRPTSGSVTIGGLPVYENLAVKRRLAWIPDELFCQGGDGVRDLMRLYKSVYPRFDETRYKQLGEVFALDEKRPIRRFSKGMQKQAAFWLAVCCMPEYLILDEPVDGLDPVMRRQVWSLLLGDVSERGTTVLVSSHNLRELEDVCDHVGILNRGQVLLERSLSDLQDNTVKLQVAYAGVTEPMLPSELNILHRSHVGRVYTYIVRGSRAEILRRMEITEPILLESIPLTLEEIFIYELGGVDYAAKDILL